MPCTAVVPTALHGGSDLLGHDLSVQGGGLDLDDVELGRGEGELVVQAALKFVDDLATAADDRLVLLALALAFSASLNQPIPDWRAPVFRM